MRRGGISYSYSPLVDPITNTSSFAPSFYGYGCVRLDAAFYGGIYGCYCCWCGGLAPVPLQPHACAVANLPSKGDRDARTGNTFRESIGKSGNRTIELVRARCRRRGTTITASSDHENIPYPASRTIARRPKTPARLKSIARTRRTP